MVRDDLGKRMKQYEAVSKSSLIRRMPVIIRIDGKAFHTFTKGFIKPFDEILIESMQETTKYLCENIQGCVLGYTQSDEITLVLVDYKKLTSASWFDSEVQKMCSIAASMATMAFNKIFLKASLDFIRKSGPFENADKMNGCFKTYGRYNEASERGAMFDARVFNIPKEEVTNNIYWRQLDAARNSIQMLGQSQFSHSQLQNKSCNKIQDMLMEEKGINWNDLPPYLKRGTCVIKKYYSVPDESGKNSESEALRSKWEIDKNIPIFKGEDRKYIDELILV